MQVIQGNLASLKPLREPVALTIGNFDGVHYGHQYLIRCLLEKAKETQAQPALLCFDPHPDVVFGTPDFKQLMTLKQKTAALQKTGIELLVVQDFDAPFSKVTAPDFLQHHLAGFFNLNYLLFGYDFRFGNRGEGDFQMARRFFEDSGTLVEQEKALDKDETQVSSTLIRDLLGKGQVAEARQCLGRPYQVVGSIEEGRKLGRTLGFPTANFGGIETLIPEDGVYHCRVPLKGRTHWAVVNIGLRPTVQGEQRTVEAHILDYSGDLYGQTLELDFYRKIRDEKKFENLDKLKLQIEKDIQNLKEHIDDEKAP